MKDIDQKFIAGALILLGWGGLVLAGYAPATDYIGALRETLFGLGIFKMTLTNPKQ